MDKNKFIQMVAERMKNQKCELFVGSGISRESGVASWSDILRPLAEEININLQDTMDLPLIAQYIINENAGNANILKLQLDKAFGKKFELNAYHRAILNMRVNRIWTTNYDGLLEKCFSSQEKRIISSDGDLATPRQNNKLEIIKIHGSITSNVNEIVLTQEDYDGFRYTRKAMVHKLRESLMNSSFLFIGYGYRDPDIRNVMIEAMYLMKENTLDHYIILDKLNIQKDESEESFKQRKKLFKYWLKELNRLGIRELIVDSHKELEQVLQDIALKSRGETVYITGSHEYKNNVARQLGEKLADTEIVLINGQSDGVGKQVLMGFTEKLIENKIDIENRLRLFPNPYSANPNFSNDPKYLPELKKTRNKLISASFLVIVFAGGMGTELEVELAKERDCFILPVVMSQEDYDNDIIKKLCSDKEVMRNLELFAKDYYQKINCRRNILLDDIINAIKGIMNNEK